MISLEKTIAFSKFRFSFETKQINDILSILLPKFVRDRISEKETTNEYGMLENQGDVAILFCDICQFDKLIISQEEKIVPFLDEIFRNFDKFCQICGLQKIETVGKTYMASAGLKACEKELNYLKSIKPVQRTLNLGIKMMKYIQNLRDINEGRIIAKIGIHYGRAISGVIGYQKPQFSLIGTTVNTTSRVCSTGQDGCIILSEEAYNQLQDQNNFVQKYVQMKGLGEKATYIYQIQSSQKKVEQIKKNIIKEKKQSEKEQSNLIRKPKQQTIKIDKSKKRTFIKTFNNNITGQLRQNSSNLNIPQQSVQFKSDYQKQIKSELQLSQYYEYLLQENVNLPLFQLDQSGKVELDFFLINITQGQEENQALEQNIRSNNASVLIRGYFENEISQVRSIANNQIIIKNHIILFIYYICKSVPLSSIYTQKSLFFIIFKWLVILLIIGSSIMLKKNNITSHIFIKLFGLQYVLLTLLAIGEIFILDSDRGIELQFCEIIFIQQNLFQIYLISLKYKIIYLAITYAMLTVVLVLISDYYTLLYHLFVCNLFEILFYKQLYELEIQEFVQQQVLKQSIDKQSNLLKYLLPSHILNQFLANQSQNNAKTFSEKIDNLTILFADIAGFTEYSNTVTPEQVLLMLKNLFVEFDKKCKEYNTYKLYTIGDCYVETTKDLLESNFQQLFFFEYNDTIQLKSIDKEIQGYFIYPFEQDSLNESEEMQEVDEVKDPNAEEEQ